MEVEKILGTIKTNGTNTLSLSLNSFPPRDNGIKSFCSHTLKICEILQGSGIWVIGDKTYDIAKDDIFILNNSEYRTIRMVYPPDRLKMLILDFEPRFIWSGHDSNLYSSYLKVFFERTENFENKIDHSDKIATEIWNKTSDIEKELREKQPEYTEMVKINLLNILVLLNRHFHETINMSSRDFLPEQKYSTISNALNYIDHNLDEELSLSELAKKAYMTPAYFSRFFKKYNGIGFSQYITKKRIQKSITLLKTTDLSVLEISNQCGFNNTANFYKAFKKLTNQVPTDFRYTEVL